MTPATDVRSDYARLLQAARASIAADLAQAASQLQNAKAAIVGAAQAAPRTPSAWTPPRFQVLPAAGTGTPLLVQAAGGKSYVEAVAEAHGAYRAWKADFCARPGEACAASQAAATVTGATRS